MTARTSVKEEVKDLRRRLSALEKLVVNLMTIEQLPPSRLSPTQKQLLKKTLSDLDKGDYRNYLTVEELKKTINK